MRVTRRAVFLDRDGVLNRALVRHGRPYSPRTLKELEILPEAHGALRRLRDVGLRLIVVTNQPDVARGTQSREVLDAMHAHLAAGLQIDEVRVCPHQDSDACLCRKPKPGLLLEAARERDVVLQDSFMVGDRWRDIEAGRRAGCTTVFIDRGYREPVPESPDARVGSIAEAADWILSRMNS
jgi:D-glycero-D-manno-heptose 1,7-bisphosphate phosphatase